MNAGTQDREDLAARLDQALVECARLREENARLKELLSSQSKTTANAQEAESPPSAVSTVRVPEIRSNDLTPEAKVGLFRRLFRGREDVYALRWESKNARSGYSPACFREWEQDADGKFRLKKDQRDREYFPLTDDVIRNHLLGKCTVGIYPLLTDETCWLLAADFDKKTWQEDARAFLETCREMEAPAALERLRSGNGGHIWIFFNRPLSATIARKFGCLILTRTMERRHQIGLDSYDRLFPNQDTMPKGGFGNLIALPLQRGPRAEGNSLFLDENLQPYPDQWRFLSTITKMDSGKVEAIVREQSDIIGVRRSFTDESAEEDPWTLPPSKKRPDKPITAPLPERVRIVRSNLLYVEKANLPSAMLNRLIRVAAFQNPEFYKAQAMRLSTFGKPRVICCAEEFPQHLGLPRGCLDEVQALLQSHGVNVDWVDERFAGERLDVSFQGTLRPLQQMAAAAMQPYDEGIICAPTAFGKTAVAAWLIAERKVKTMVLVHRQQLLDQWRERLALFLDLSLGDIGQIGGGKTSRAGGVDVGMIQSLNRRGEIKDLVAEYGQVIVDECHHLSAFSFEQALRQVKARYVVGLTATPIRKDGHHPIIYMQCGPSRYQLSEKRMAASALIEHIVIPKRTNFRLPSNLEEPSIQDIYRSLMLDEPRNELIVNDLLQALEAGRSPLLLTERTEHLQLLAGKLNGAISQIIELKGGMGRKQRQEVMERLQAIPDCEPRVILATGRYIGEGFDDARLDTLFLAMPISWRGTLQQYVGRLHRTHDNKRIVRVYDYVDGDVLMLMRMYEKRVRGYKAIGYSIEEHGITDYSST